MSLQTSHGPVVGLILMLALLCGCSDYPTSGRVEFRPPTDASVPASEIDKIKIELSGVKGSVFELDAAVMEALDAALEDLATLKKDPIKAGTDFARKYPDADFSKIAAAREKLAQRRARFEQDVAKAVAEREKQLAAEVAALRARHAQSAFDAVQAQLDEARNQHQDIAHRVLEATNKIIVDESLPVPVLDARYFKLSFETKTWRQNTPQERIDCQRPGRMWSYSTDTHIIIDERATRRSCSYYRKPSEQLTGHQYETAIRTAYDDVRALGIEDHEAAVKQAKQALDNASIVARNQTGIDRRRIGSELEQTDSRLKRAELTQKHGLDAERILGFLGVSGAEPPPLNALAAELGLDPDAENRRIAGQLQTATFAERFDPDTNLHLLTQGYEAELRNAVVRRHIVKETPIRETGEFSGLDGGAGLLVVVAQGDVAFNHPERRRGQMAITWSEIADMRDEAEKKRIFPGGGVLVQGTTERSSAHRSEDGRELRDPDDARQWAVGAVNRHLNALRRERSKASG
jgi:hypothetical protein